jgi:putative ABC transport system permease protein
MTVVASWRTALRIAQREARRSKGRSALVVAMIALPMLALSFAAVTYDMFTLTGEEQARQTMGAADARIQWQYKEAVNQPAHGEYGWPAQPSTQSQGRTEKPAPTTTDLLAKLPSGSRAVPLNNGSVALKTPHGISEPNLITVDGRSPLTAGYLTMLSGRAPVAITEAALTKQALELLGAKVGGTITSGDGQRTYTVVGEVEFPSLLQAAVLLAPVPTDGTKGLQLDGQSWLVDTPAPLPWSAVRELNKSGIVVASRDVFINPPPAAEVPEQYSPGVTTEQLAIGVLVAGLALLEIVLMAGPAFAVSARRRQRQLALVAANGGTPAHVRRIVLADGVVLGCVGALVGAVLGIATAFGARPYVEDLLSHSRAGAYRVFPAALATLALLSVITGVLAALVPAFITARQNVVASLAGRRGVTRSKKRWIVVGTVAVAVGSAIVVFGTFGGSAQIMLAGLVVGELGLVLCTPALVGLIAKLGRILPLAPRIALRDAARNRAAAAPAISAVMAAVAGSVAIGLYFDSDRSQQLLSQVQSVPTGYATIYTYQQHDPSEPAPPSLASIENGLRSTLPVADIRSYSAPDCLPDTSATTGDTKTNSKERFCFFEIQLPPDEVCPYLKVMRDGLRQLTADEQKAAKADHRCDQNNLYAGGNTIVDDGSALPLLTGASADDVAKATAVLHAGGVVVREAKYLRNGMVTFAVGDVRAGQASGDPYENAPRMSFPGYALTTGVPGGRTIVSAGALAKAHLGSTITGVIASTTRVPTQAEEESFTQQMSNLRTGGSIERGPKVEIPVELWLIMGAAALITLGAAAIGTGLAAADGRADLSTLASVGASPRLRRGLSLSQSGVIAGLGSLLGAGAGLGAAIAVLVALNEKHANTWPSPLPYPIHVPWISLVAALLVVPFVAILGAGMLTRSRLPIERRL